MLFFSDEPCDDLSLLTALLAIIECGKLTLHSLSVIVTSDNSDS